MVEVTEMHTNPQVALVVESVSERRLDGPPQRVRIERGRAVTLDDGHRLEFAGHSHKRVEADQSSPLIVSTRWSLPGFEPTDDTVNLETSDGERSWRFRDRELTLLDWDYDRWMELEIHALARVRVPAP